MRRKLSEHNQGETEHSSLATIFGASQKFQQYIAARTVYEGAQVVFLNRRRCLWFGQSYPSPHISAKPPSNQLLQLTPRSAHRHACPVSKIWAHAGALVQRLIRRSPPPVYQTLRATRRTGPRDKPRCLTDRSRPLTRPMNCSLKQDVVEKRVSHCRKGLRGQQ